MTDKQTQAHANESNTQKDPNDWVTGDEPMTGAQRSYLKTLSEEAKEPFDESLTKAHASQRIDELQHVTGRGVGNTGSSATRQAASKGSAGTETGTVTASETETKSDSNATSNRGPSGSRAGSGGQDEASDAGEEDPGAGLDDPETQEAMRQEPLHRQAGGAA